MLPYNPKKFIVVNRDNPLFLNVEERLHNSYWLECCPPEVSVSGVDEPSLALLMLDECNVFKNQPIKVSAYAQFQRCNTIAAYEHYRNAEIAIGFGFAYSADLSTWYMHSFNVAEDGVIIEPTPLIREIYWGRVLTPDEAAFYVEGEWSNLQTFGLV